jgi:NADH dehydrogenase (ubiquinone) 1 alpha subcomplex subunit 5
LFLLQIVNERSAILKSNTDIQELEKKLNCGQVEECITQATYELDLAKRILEDRAWEPLIADPPVDQWKWPL